MHPTVRCDHNGCRGYLVVVILRRAQGELLVRSCTRCRCTVALDDQDELLYAGGGCPLYGNGRARTNRRNRRVRAVEG